MTNAGSLLPNEENSCGSAAVMPVMICAMRGPTFWMTVPIESTSWVVNPLMSALSLPSSASQFCHAAFIMPTEPSMVVAASLAVVPLMPICSCMMWMACTTSENLSMDRSPISPFACLTLFASWIRRSISDFVPPYPSFRLSSMA